MHAQQQIFLRTASGGAVGAAWLPSGLLRQAAWMVLAAALLIWPALWNGYPLVFADTGTYLGQALQGYLGWDRPPFYSLFLLATHWRLSLWMPIVVQGLLTAYVLGLVLRGLGQGGGMMVFGIAALLAIFTGLPFFAAQLMPDIFTGLLVLVLWVLAFRWPMLRRGEAWWLLLLATGCIAVHQSHIPLAAGLVLLSAALPGADARWRRFLRLSAPVVLAALAVVAVNAIGHHRVSLSPFGSVFLATRLIHDGPGLAYLRRACPQQHYAICAVLDRATPGHNAFLWQPGSPLWHELGGAKQWATEAGEIVRGSLRQDPAGVARAVAGNAMRQLFLLDTGDGLEAWRGIPGPEPLIAVFFPARELQAYRQSHQYQGLLEQDVAAFAPLHRAVAMVGLAALLLLPLVWPLARQPAVLALIAFVLAAAIGNAIITGGLSGPAVRYGARLAWLYVFIPACCLLPGYSVGHSVQHRDTP